MRFTFKKLDAMTQVMNQPGFGYFSEMDISMEK
jgi:hypothetical protein